MVQETLRLSEILTLEELADYLRLPLEVIERQAIQGKIPEARKSQHSNNMS